MGVPGYVVKVQAYVRVVSLLLFALGCVVEVQADLCVLLIVRERCV